ncbi:zinc finger BED domain-containing protein DAYSLEEPER-like [Rhagoletis pomonella]|uniref:zinc finger BED domain-containing protein DAYSLEEPER-like n=1 Tax=Rhagoletis pomonella TaxID=28610 RepID=UPI0017805E66|nr:zinc finger BED domain-containing protein DAYSLEEPER-like [Rhagoletis pomonella]
MFALTTDAWTSTAVVSYITITTHFIDDNWELRSYVLETFDHPQRHTSENLRKAVEDCVSRWNMDGKVIATVHDNARNVASRVTLSMVRPIIYRLKENFLKGKPTDSVLIKNFKETAVRELQDRFLNKTSTANFEPTCVLLAEILDPLC